MAHENSTFRVFEAITLSDRKAWHTLWEHGSAHEVFASPDYVDLFSNSASKACCAALFGDGWSILYPFLLRDLPSGELDSRGFAGTTDIASPYGFGGPFQFGDVQNADMRRFWMLLTEWERGVKVVSEFTRFGLFDCGLQTYPGRIREVGFNVVRELDSGADEIWADFAHKVRKNVKKAKRSGVTVELDTECRRLDSSVAVYLATMKRREADDSLHFSGAFFERLCKDLPGGSALFHAVVDDSVVSTEIVLISGESVYSFLGGTDQDAFPFRPNDYLKYAIIQWAQEIGKKRFVLGGGYRPNDGILRYKAGFAPSGMVPFHVGERILDEQVYSDAVDAMKALEHDRGAHARVAGVGSYFPAYRG